MTSVDFNCNTKIIVNSRGDIHMKRLWIYYETNARKDNNLSVNNSAILDRGIEKGSGICGGEHK